NGNVGSAVPLAFLTTGATGATGINAGIVRTSGNQSYNNPTTIGVGVTLQSTGGNLVAAAPVTATSGTLSLSAAGTVSFNNAANNFNTVNLNTGGSVVLRDANAIVLGPSSIGGALGLTANGAVTQIGAITVGGASTIAAGAGPVVLTGANDFGGDIAVTTTGVAQLNDVNNLTLGASSASTLTATAGGGITLNGNVNATAGGNSIVLAGTAFTNDAGPAALNPGAGRWLVWSTNPALDSRGGLAYNFKQYNAIFGVTPVLGTGNGFLYSIAPAITPTLVGTVSKVYDGTNIATLVPANFAAVGAIDGDTVTLNNPASGTYDNRNVGTNKPVRAPGVSIVTATNGAATVYGYQLASTTATGNVGTITAAPLTLTAATNTKVYDGTVSSAAVPTVTGLVAGDTVTGLAQVYADKNAGTGKTLLVSSYAVNDGNGGNNYSVTTIDNTTGIIHPAALTVTAAAGQTKVYGDADPLPFAYAITSGALVAGDTLTGALSRTAGENVGGYALTQNTLTAGSNYALAFVSNPFTITPATLTYLANAATVRQGTPFPVFTGTVEGFKGADTQASATTGTLAFTTPATNSNTAGSYPINGSGLTANFGNYVFVQAPANATALTIQPHVEPLPPVGPLPPVVILQAYTGALASAAQSESACAELESGSETETLCGAQQNFRASEQRNLTPGWRRVIDLGTVSLIIEGDGMRTP
ncbi:MAG: hypothetical protein JNK68_07110, partial [Betaproteobacteria bacterium]|nr:hypothetical protein [Betaproteobacteria bacterium]